jgi:hypothetical protein
MHDVILFYTKGTGPRVFNTLYMEAAESSKKGGGVRNKR